MKLYMHKRRKLTCLPLLLIMAACGPSGYYDSEGRYHAYGENDTHRNDHAIAAPASSNTPASSVYVPEGNVSYYGQAHTYPEGANAVRIPREFFPPSGMCRVWFPNKPASDQPPPESCQGIQDRAPADSYVIYGK